MAETKKKKIAIIGGGAAGFFTAINAAKRANHLNLPLEICIYESSSNCLKKVKISGGGRCNVTHHIYEVRPFSQNYPRGARELLSPLNQFQAHDTVEWFADKGIKLVPEKDGRMFPVSNSSQTIIDCFNELADQLGVQVIKNQPVTEIHRASTGFEVKFKSGEPVTADSILIATGSANRGYQLAESLGHTITERAPSLFSFKISDPLIDELPGLSFPNTSLSLKIDKQKGFKQQGPLLITHWGLSGPAILKLSAWAAREMKTADYQAKLIVNWMGDSSADDIRAMLEQLKAENSKSFLKNVYPTVLPKRFWLKLLEQAQVSPDRDWANLSKKQINKISRLLFEYEFSILGQNRFKDEFVECGGVSLKEVNFKTMESKICPGLYFAGEILDIDGITGGFNFQNAWTTGWLSARSMVRGKESGL